MNITMMITIITRQILAISRQLTSSYPARINQMNSILFWYIVYVSSINTQTNENDLKLRYISINLISIIKDAFNTMYKRITYAEKFMISVKTKIILLQRRQLIVQDFIVVFLLENKKIIDINFSMQIVSCDIFNFIFFGFSLKHI